MIATDAGGPGDVPQPRRPGPDRLDAGATPAGDRSKTVFAIVNEETRQPAENPVARVLREGVVVGLANHTALVARDGTERPIEDSAAPIKAGDGTVVGVILVFRDVTAEAAGGRGPGGAAAGGDGPAALPHPVRVRPGPVPGPEARPDHRRRQ